MLDWNKLKLFYEVATAASITRAAERLEISQPTLSRSIMDLEHRIKAQLFKRNKKGISLTHEGEILYEYAKKMHIEAEMAENIRPSNLENKSSSFTVCTTPAIAQSWLMRFIPSFLQNYPNIDLKVICQPEPSENMMADVYIKPFIPMQPTLCQHFLMKFTMQLYASQKYIDKYGVPKDSQDLDSHRLISFGIGSNNSFDNYNWILKVGHKASSLRAPYLVFSSADYILRAAAEGMGIVELGRGFPESMGVDLVEILPGLDGPTAEIFYIYPEHRKNQPEITAFLEHIVAHSKTATSKETLEDFSAVKLRRIG